MNVPIATAALAALLLAGPARADDPKAAPTSKDSVMTFLRNLKLSLAQSAVQGERKKQRNAAVAAVRGESQQMDAADPDEPTLKGDARAEKARRAQAEDADLEKAVDLVLAGKTDEGVKALEAFKAKHPKSHSLARVQEAIDKSKMLSADEPASDKPASTAPAAKAAPSKN